VPVSWQVSDLIDLDFFLRRDENPDISGAGAADRAVYLAYADTHSPPFDRKALIRRWLDEKRAAVPEKQSLPGTLYLGIPGAFAGFYPAAGLPLGRLKVEVGPVKTDQMLFILLDRALIYFSHVSNWAHSRREPPLQAPAPAGRQGITSQWEAANRKEFARFFAAARKNDWPAPAAIKPVVTGVLGRTLQDLSERKAPVE